LIHLSDASILRAHFLRATTTERGTGTAGTVTTIFAHSTYVISTSSYNGTFVVFTNTHVAWFFGTGNFWTVTVLDAAQHIVTVVKTCQSRIE